MEDEVKREKLVIIYCVIFGLVEWMFVILLEYYVGKWFFWLSLC